MSVTWADLVIAVETTVSLRGLEGSCIELRNLANRILRELDHLVDCLLLFFLVAAFDERLLFILRSAVEGHIIVQHVFERELDLLLETVLSLPLNRLGH